MVLVEIGAKISNAIKKMRDSTVINNDVCFIFSFFALVLIIGFPGHQRAFN